MRANDSHDDESQDFSFYRTVIDSPQWKEWEEYVTESQDFDISECMECGIISPEHFQAFLGFVKGRDL